MIASLMMYARPELAQANQNFWVLIRDELSRVNIFSPENLSQTADEFLVWEHPELVLSQTCGMPYRLRLHQQVALVGTLDYGLADCPAGYYRSALIVPKNDPRDTIQAFRTATFAYNQTISQSGFAAPYFHVTPHGFWFKNTLQTGQHHLSALAVAQGDADIASIDAVTWRLLQKYEPFAENLRVLEWTTPTPGLPLITAKSQNAKSIFDAVTVAIKNLSKTDRDLLGICGIQQIPKADYLAIPNPPQL